ncbi:PREDICTED: uncharacterized protein LOC104594731 [Nelumbo nucifera]|uniref:Uncharacterized protein n=2 Tax=Nelumbo nucifera TaxID=4432 RepID=A0A822Y0B6_NELNU|nr:PREDICTED: uncharacterized protein LOC104594731 [Nelumbo nucifera]DAD26040.1 TPA_asm: hypothetical protein HUJ06_027508 [Nelumbo nucifera]
MDLLHLGKVTARSLWSRTKLQKRSLSSSSPLKPNCSRRNSERTPQNGDSNDDNSKGDRFSTDWDKAWSSFKKRGKKTFFSQFNPDKYVSWNPRRSNYPLSEEVDPIKRTERSNLMLWTSPSFTLAGAIVVVSLLLIYTLLAPVK